MCPKAKHMPFWEKCCHLKEDGTLFKNQHAAKAFASAILPTLHLVFVRGIKLSCIECWGFEAPKVLLFGTSQRCFFLFTAVIFAPKSTAANRTCAAIFETFTRPARWWNRDLLNPTPNLSVWANRSKLRPPWRPKFLNRPSASSPRSPTPEKFLELPGSKLVLTVPSRLTTSLTWLCTSGNTRVNVPEVVSCLCREQNVFTTYSQTALLLLR